MKKDARFLLFNNAVYSTSPEDPKDQFFGPDPLYYTMFGSENDEELLDVVQQTILQKRKFAPESKLFLFDEILTRVRLKVREYEKKGQLRYYDLYSACKVIVNDRYPVEVKYLRNFKRWTAKRKTELQLGKHSLSFGRLKLVEMLEYARFEPAVPYLREIILHEVNSRMITYAMIALQNIGTRTSAQCINELLQQKHIPYWKRYKLVSCAHRQNYSELVQGLRFTFEECYHYYPVDSASLYYDATIQQNVLEICSTIPTLASLAILEMGIAHPYDHVERTACLQIKKWIELIISRISKGIDDGLEKELIEIIKRYDIHILNENYSRLRKRQKIL